jgi:hypothetical protein
VGEDERRLAGERAEHLGGGLIVHVVEAAAQRLAESWLSKFGQADEWSFCLRAARMAREQERR